jgi:hypothetical protein
MDDQDTITITGGSGSDVITGTGNTTILDLSGYGAQPTLTSADISTITLDDLTTFNWSNTNTTVTIPVSGGGGGGASGSGYTISGAGTGYTWANTTSPTVVIGNDGMEIRDNGDIKIGNVSLKAFIEKMEQRLAILVPDPERLEKFEALKKAYEHYKTMESLCFPDEKDKKE